MTELRLLGPIELWAAHTPVDLGPAKRRALVAALAVDATRPVTVATLVDRVWDESPPTQVRSAIYAHVAHIRRSLAEAAALVGVPVRLDRRGGGYVLDIDPERVDLHRFRRLVNEARDRHDPVQRARSLRQALDLWRGAPLSGLSGSWVERVREGCAQQRVDAALAWAEAELQLGNHQVVISEMSGLAGEYPLIEPMTAALMRALALAGRSGEALSWYCAFRARLADELGTDPDVELQELHQVILRGRIEELRPQRAMAPSPRSDPAPALRPVPVPAQLPPPVLGFTGRERELARLHQMAFADSGGCTPTGGISAITGTAGVGKTSLAVRWAHMVRDRFPDGQLYVDLRGFAPSGQAVEPAVALRGFLDAFGVPADRVPADLDAQAALYRSLLAGKKVLVVLDNARDSDQVRPLLPAGPGCLTLVTSRNQLSSLVTAEGATPVSLDLLSSAEARDLLANRLGHLRVEAEPQATADIIAACERLPLALALVAARAAGHPHFPLRTLAEELQSTHRDAALRLNAFPSVDTGTDIETVFSWSYRHLGTDARRLFRLLGLHLGPEISASAAAGLAGVSPERIRTWLDELVGGHLVNEHAPGRYGLHDLLRSYAYQLAQTHDRESERHAALRRMLDHYLWTGFSAARLLNPTRDVIEPAPCAAGVTPERLADYPSALAWFSREHTVLLGVIERAAECRFHTHTWQLAWCVDDFLDMRLHWPDLVAVHRAALTAARSVGEKTEQARAHRNLGLVHTQLGRLDDAHTYLLEALELGIELGDVTEQARCHHCLDKLFEQQGRYPEALHHAQESLRLFREAGHRTGIATALNSLGWCHSLLGDHRQALAYCEEALTRSQKLGHRHAEAATWDSLGHAHRHLGHYERAVSCYQQAVDIYGELGDHYNAADSLIGLGGSQADSGDLPAARRSWTRALAVLEEFDHPDADRVRAEVERLEHTPPG